MFHTFHFIINIYKLQIKYNGNIYLIVQIIIFSIQLIFLIGLTL